jgi:diadenosine tetraphosphate (Ap4A) HIT family hydrolase
MTSGGQGTFSTSSTNSTPVEGVTLLQDCVFCTKFGDDRVSADSSSASWYDVVLAESVNCCLVPTIGALTQGNSLIISKFHATSMASLPDSSFEDFLAFKNEVIRGMLQIFPTILCFEHGVAYPQTSSGSCIDHAHWHILPASADLIRCVLHSLELKSVGGFDEVRAKVHGGLANGYLYLEHSNGESYVLYPSTPLESQLVRRLIARAQGRPDEWDWAVFPMWDNVRSTIRILTPRSLGQ